MKRKNESAVKLGRLGGLAGRGKSKARTPEQARAAVNARWVQMGVLKTEVFVEAFPHTLEDNEWQVKWPIEHKFGKTYNPDFWCPDLNCFIEVATSVANVCTESIKWQTAILRGYDLRVFWWKGQDITELVKEDPKKAYKTVKAF